MTRQRIIKLIDRHAPSEGFSTPLEGVQLFRLVAPVERAPAIYPASVCSVVQGQKLTYFGGEPHRYGGDSLLCSTMPIPVDAEVPHASPEEPVLGVLMSLDTPGLRETLVAMEAAGLEDHRAPAAGPTPGLVVAAWDDDFTDALLRLLELLADPTGLRVLGPARLREVYFALIRGDAGQAIRHTFGISRGLGRALSLLRENVAAPLTVDELAREAGMSRAVFHRKFKALTKHSPLQFIKALRLNEGATLLAGGMGVTDVALTIGYQSPSQFSREFSRRYGQPPRQYAKAVTARLAS